MVTWIDLLIWMLILAVVVSIMRYSNGRSLQQKVEAIDLDYKDALNRWNEEYAHLVDAVLDSDYNAAYAMWMLAVIDINGRRGGLTDSKSIIKRLRQVLNDHPHYHDIEARANVTTAFTKRFDITDLRHEEYPRAFAYMRHLILKYQGRT